MPLVGRAVGPAFAAEGEPSRRFLGPRSSHFPLDLPMNRPTRAARLGHHLGFDSGSRCRSAKVGFGRSCFAAPTTGSARGSAFGAGRAGPARMCWFYTFSPLGQTRALTADGPAARPARSAPKASEMQATLEPSPWCFAHRGSQPNPAKRASHVVRRAPARKASCDKQRATASWARPMPSLRPRSVAPGSRRRIAAWPPWGDALKEKTMKSVTLTPADSPSAWRSCSRSQDARIC
jgi:hypothetical protein